MTNSMLLRGLMAGSLLLIGCAKQGTSSESESGASASDETTGGAMAADPPSTTEATPATASVVEPGPVGATGPTAATGGDIVAPTAPVAPPAPAPLTDGQIVRVSEAVDSSEIDQAKEVQKKAKNPEVKKLAARILQQHTKNKQKAQTVAKRAQLKAEESTVATDVTTKSEESLQSIKTAAAPSDAERAFVDGQVRQQESVLELLNTRLIPNAINADLKAQLEETRKIIEKHIEETKRVQQALQAAPASPPSG